MGWVRAFPLLFFGFWGLGRGGRMYKGDLGGARGWVDGWILGFR